MKDVQKMFLLVWIPIVVVVLVGVTMAIGASYNLEVGGGWVSGVRTLEDIWVAYPVVVGLSVILFWMIGLDWDDDTMRKRGG